MKPITLKIAPGAGEDIAVVGDYVRVKTASVPVRIEAGNGDADDTIEQGDALNLKPFTRLRVSHSDAAEQTITLQIGDGTSADSSKVGGSITANPTQASSASAHGPVTVTNASAVIAAANSARRYLFIQNRDAAGTVYVNLNGAVATVGAGGNGIKIPPGGYYESNAAWVCTAAITAIGDIANNANVLLMEGD